MAGDTTTKAITDHTPTSSNKRPPHTPSSVPRKPRWDHPSSSSSKPSPKPGPTPSNPSPSTKQPTQPKPKPNPNPNPSPSQFNNPHHTPGPHPPFPFHDPPPPPTYGFQMLDRRTIFLADGSARSYFALPPDYQDIPPPTRFNPGLKRKFGEDIDRQKQQLLHYGNVGSSREDEIRGNKAMKFSGSRHEDKIDAAIMKAFLHFVKMIFENCEMKRNLLENGKFGPIRCLACGGSSKDFPDVHFLVLHAYNSDNADLRVDHLGLHRALCALMGWNCTRTPDNSRMYQFLPPDEAAAFQDDLIVWPPMVIICNTNTGKGKDGRVEGLGNKAMDSKLRDLGFSGGKSKSLYNREGHLGVTLIKFSGDQSGLKEAMRLSDHFEKDRHGRREWAHFQLTGDGRDDENNPNLVMADERTGEKRRILYGYLLTAVDLDKVDNETRKKVSIESKLEKLHASK